MLTIGVNFIRISLTLAQLKRSKNQINLTTDMMNEILLLYNSL